MASKDDMVFIVEGPTEEWVKQQITVYEAHRPGEKRGPDDVRDLAQHLLRNWKQVVKLNDDLQYNSARTASGVLFGHFSGRRVPNFLRRNEALDIIQRLNAAIDLVTGELEVQKDGSYRLPARVVTQFMEEIRDD